MVTVADCQRVQTNWFRFRTIALGGEVWTDGPLMWTDGPDGQNLMFPETMSTAAVLRGVDRARVRGRAIVGAWLSLDTDAKPLADTGFERGWSPWWMTTDLSDWRPSDSGTPPVCSTHCAPRRVMPEPSMRC